MINIFKFTFFVLVSVLASSGLAEKLFQIDLSKVESRQIYGGLGSSGTMGEVTEFFVSELDVPLASISGQKASAFKKTLYIYKSDSYYACPNDKLDQTCFKCSDCSSSQSLANFKKFDIKNADRFRKKVFKTMGVANINKNGKISVDFIFPVKGEKPLELMVKTEKFGSSVDVLLPFQYSHFRAAIYKSNDDPQYYLCPESGFSRSCLVCENCLEKIERIKAFKN